MHLMQLIEEGYTCTNMVLLINREKYGSLRISTSTDFILMESMSGRIQSQVNQSLWFSFSETSPYPYDAWTPSAVRCQDTN